MRLLKPEWVNHGGKPIFSVDIHPDGQKFATGGQGEDSGKVVIWNMRPVRREEDEKNEFVPKLLCQMDNHLACVNCVRWSNSGKLLASGGDDKLVMIWRPATFIGPANVFGSGGNVANVEQWRCASVLRYHSGDVMDVAWSPHDAWLATGSIDNSVVIWNACKFPEVIATLRGHSGLVKGVTWDPVGKYVASQADDKSLKVWSTLDWRLEASITEPFRECGGTTQVLRLGWSPDGHYIVSAHAMNNSGPTAQIVEREGWRSSMDFVGHRKAVTVVRFNPKIFQWKARNGGADKPGFPYSCCAIGSKDRSLSVWLTCLKRPLVVVHDLFDKSIMDISWNVSGFEMLVCSMDGSVAFAEFSLEELGNPLSQEEKNAIHQKTYGKSLSISSELTIGSTVIESPAMLHLQQQQWGAEERPGILQEGPAAEERVEGTGEAGTPGDPMGSAMPYRTVLNGESLEQIRKNLLKNQKETRTPDGRRRITPLCIAQLDISEYQSSAFSSVPLASSVSQFALFSSNPSSPVPDGDAEVSNPIVAQQEPDKQSPEREALPSPVPMSPSKLEPMRALDSRFTERPKVPASPSPVAPTTTQQQSSVTNVPGNAGAATVAEKSARETAAPLTEGVSTVTPSGVAGRVETAAASLVVSVRPQRESSSDSDDRAAVGVKGHVPPPVPRKKPEGEDGNALKKKGRPRKDPKIVATGLVIQASTHVEKDPCRLSVTTTPTLKLPVIGAQKSFSLQVSSEPGLSLEVENETGGVGNLKLHRLVCRREGAGIWDTHLTSRVLAAAASSEAVAVACEDRTLIAFSSCGRRLLPPLILPALPSSLQLNQHFILLLTVLGTLHVWDLRSNRAVIDGQSLSPILTGSDVSVTRIVVTNQGMPLVTLNTGRSYSYSTSLAAWMQVCDPQNPLTLVSDLQSNLLTQHALHCAGPLASLQSQGGSGGRQQASRLASFGPKLRGAATLIHLEGQVAAALSLHSPSEYRFWLLSYARYLAHEGLESRLRELCTELLGPVPVSSSSQWDPYVLGLSRRGLLREVLPLFGTNLKLQRLFSELQEQLEAAATD
uniref:protein HIRA-like isoform X2 n=1 Tax=Myxine glutinosa TaxID=7769 RepID=UPI00358E990C